MASCEVELKIKTFLSDNLLVPFDGNIKNDTSLFKTGIVDSYGFVELVLFIEREFAISVQDTELVGGDFDSLVNIVALVKRKIDS